MRSMETAAALDDNYQDAIAVVHKSAYDMLLS